MSTSEATPTDPGTLVGNARAPHPGKRPIEAFGATHAGLHRLVNEDAFLVAPHLGAVAVADGVGGSDGGEVASQVAIDTVAAVLRREVFRALVAVARPAHVRTVEQAMTDIAFEAQARIQARGWESGLSRMGTTLSAVLFAAGHAFVVYLGDSRVHRIRRGTIQQITTDHTLVQEYTNQYGPPPAELVARYGHIVTRALSAGRELVEPEVRTVPVQPGDLFLVSTDGLTNMVGEDTILDIVSRAGSLEVATEGLIDAALAAGGWDNITAVLARPLVEERR